MKEIANKLMPDKTKKEENKDVIVVNEGLLCKGVDQNGEEIKNLK